MWESPVFHGSLVSARSWLAHLQSQQSMQLYLLEINMAMTHLTDPLKPLTFPYHINKKYSSALISVIPLFACS